MRRIPIEMTPEGYATFIRCKSLPSYRVKGNEVVTDERSYALVFGKSHQQSANADDEHLFDYQRWVTNHALDRQRYAAFLDCGMGKSCIELAWAHAVARTVGRVLFLCPLAVMEDIQRECQRFYGYRMSDLRSQPWTTDIAILNWESHRDLSGERYAGICLDESSILKASDGKTRKWLQRLAAQCTYRLACSATPSPNEQAEYGSHAVWLGYSSTLNEFYSRFFVKDGNQWRLKGHAVDPFYRHLRAWACYIQRPSELGFVHCDAELPEPPDIRDIETSAPDYRPRDQLFVTDLSLKDSIKVFGAMRSDTSQPRFRDACEAVQGSDRCLVWASRNAEEQAFHREMGGHLITGTTPIEERVDIIDDFRAGRVKVLVSKPRILGFGVNLPETRDMLYSGYTWSFEQLYQAIRRGHRYGREGRLRVHMPVTDVERPVRESLRRKTATFDDDVRRLQSAMQEPA